MYCLYCGFCCEKLSPLTDSEEEPCPMILRVDDFVFCSSYDHRPWQCKNHEFQCSKCPIGMDKLEIKTPEEAYRRIDDGYYLIRNNFDKVKAEEEYMKQYNGGI